MATHITVGNFDEGRAGVGNVNPAMVRERAAQLAIIDGRTEAEVSEQDLDQAERELRGDLTTVEQGMEVAGENPPIDNVQSDAEVLVKQGMDEAVHDDMLQSGRMNLEDLEEREEEG